MLGRSEDIREGLRLGAFLLGPRLDADAFAVLHAAHDEAVGHEVSLRVLRPEGARDPVFTRHFRRGVDLARRAAGPGAVAVRGEGEQEGIPFAVLEPLSGETLRDRMRERGRLGVTEASSVLRALLETLARLHERGIVHGDVKPGNLFATGARGAPAGAGPGGYALLDFTCARRGADGGVPLGAFFGTPEYAAPEQCAGEPLDARADLYAAGIVLFECLTGILPIVDRTPAGFLARHMVWPPKTLALAAPDRSWPPELERFLARALEKRPGDRFASARDMAEALRDAAARAARPRGLLARLIGA